MFIDISLSFPINEITSLTHRCQRIFIFLNRHFLALKKLSSLAEWHCCARQESEGNFILVKKNGVTLPRFLTLFLPLRHNIPSMAMSVIIEKDVTRGKWNFWFNYFWIVVISWISLSVRLMVVCVNVNFFQSCNPSINTNCRYLNLLRLFWKYTKEK